MLAEPVGSAERRIHHHYHLDLDHDHCHHDHDLDRDHDREHHQQQCKFNDATCNNQQHIFDGDCNIPNLHQSDKHNTQQHEFHEHDHAARDLRHKASVGGAVPGRRS